MVRFETMVRMTDIDYTKLYEAMMTLQLIAENTNMFDDLRTQDLSAQEIFKLVVDIIESEIILDD